MIIKTSYPFMKPPPSARLIRGHRLAQGLVGAWIMAENGGLQVFDLSGNGNTGVLTGGDVTWAAGKYGSALDFPGTVGDYVNCTPAEELLAGLTSFTVVISVLPTDNVTKGIIGATTTGTDKVFVLAQIASASNYKFAFRVYNDAAASPEVRTGAYVPNISHQVIAVWDGANLRIFVDGQIATADVALTGVLPANPRQLHIGAGGAGAGYSSTFYGDIDFVYIYNHTLIASETTEITYNPFCMFERKARTALLSGYEVVAPPVGMAGAMTTNSGYWGW